MFTNSKNNENTARNDKKFIDEYIDLINHEEQNCTYDLIYLEPVSTPLLVIYSAKGVQGGLLGDVYMYTEIAGLQTFGCMAILYEPSSNYIKTAYYGASRYWEMYYYITDDWISEYGKTEETTDNDGNRHYIQRKK